LGRKRVKLIGLSGWMGSKTDIHLYVTIYFIVVQYASMLPAARRFYTVLYRARKNADSSLISNNIFRHAQWIVPSQLGENMLTVDIKIQLRLFCTVVINGSDQLHTSAALPPGKLPLVSTM
jgi:hypothetical protein